ncbi:MAG: FG-GAP-like repeat-containing protein [Gemmatimonadetes bacterium]|nr:FG-GAP-like repeat-containing protein [Gemmatimonadota bacterium]
MKRRPIASLVALVALAACGETAPRVGEWQQGTGYRWRELDVPGATTSIAGARAGFTALPASRTGITHANDVSDEHAMANRDLLIGAGVAVADIDGDGHPDLFLASVEKPAALYRNAGGLKFEDVTRASGLRTDSLATTGATFADVDNDGDADLLVGTHGGPVTLWLNDGKGHFTDGTAASGLSGGYAATTMTLADVDKDGDLDLYVATYKVRNALDAYPPQARAFDQVVTKTATGYAVKPEWVKEYRIEDRPDLGGIVRSQRADPDLFFINDGNGHFTHTAISGARFRDESGKPLAAEPDFFTLAARFYDVNGDGAPDLYVCNDFEDPDQFWLNDGTGNFRLAPTWALAATSNTCMSVDFGDVDRDGTVDIFTADMLSPTLAERQTKIPTHTPLPKPLGLTGARPQWMRNMLHVGRGDGSWAQVADFAGVAATDWTWGSAFLDVHLDGFEDLITVSGHRWDIRDADTFDRIRNSFPRVPWDKEQGQFPRLATRNITLRNKGDATFAPMKDGWGLGAEAAISQGIALADFDLDGDLDLIVTRLDAAAQLYRNEAAAPRIAVRLAGAGGNRAGIGAVVSLAGGARPAQSREITAGGNYLSGSEPLLTFAAAPDADLLLTVRWPGGRLSVIGDARANRLYEINEPAVDAPAALAVVPDDAHPLFEDATARLGGQTHHESVYDDVRRQNLLPGRLSQLGPGLAWVDVDADGREDLVVGDGKGGALTLLLNRGDRFSPQRLGATAAGDLTGIVPLPDGRGGVRLAVGQSNYEAGTLDSALAIPGVLSVALARGGRPAAVAGGDTASVGPLAVGDVNGDGFLDLFVGARVVGGAWPVPTPSRLLIGSADGSFVPDAANARAMAALGLVSAALIVDVTGDAAPDLVVAGEFGPVRVLRNERGTLVDATASLGLDKLRSRWIGLAAGDFDGDGRLDLVVTSWGRNLPWGASESRPHVLYMGPFGGQTLGLVFARADSLTRQEMPLESFARLGVAFPTLRSRVATYGDFAKRSVQTLFGADTLGAVRIGATTYDQTILLNRGDRFEARSLPAMAQRAPAFGVNVADFDGDGREDLFLAQNFFPTEIGTMRFDAGVGLVLLGDGQGGFRPLGVTEAGVVVRGDSRGSAVADFDGDGRPDLAVSQNAGATTLWRNRTGQPGARIRLIGPATNPWGVGAQVWLFGKGWRGPARSVAAGSGYWSSDSPSQVLGGVSKADSVRVRWPSGVETVAPLGGNSREVLVRAPGEPIRR